MNFINMIQTQWPFILIAALIIAAVFSIKKLKPEFSKTFNTAALVGTLVLLIIFAVVFKQPDLFLLLPVAIICCELFGYIITGKIIAVLLVDYLLILLLNYLLTYGKISELINSILFIAAQLATAIVAGIIMDKHLKKLQAQRNKKAEKDRQKAAEESEKSRQKIDDIMASADKSTAENKESEPFEEQAAEALIEQDKPDDAESSDYSVDLSKYGLDDKDMK